MSDINLERLRLFVAILEHGSLTAAAKSLHTTQPAASRNLKLLEDGLGVELFRRVGRGLELTAAGRALEPRAYDVLARADRIARDVQNASREDFFSLKLGTTDSVATYILPSIIRPLRERFDGLALQWRTDRSARLLQAVRDGDLDAIVIAASNAPVAPQVYRIGPYHMRYFGRREIFPELASVRHEDDLDVFPIVELTALPGQPSLIGEHTPSYARVGSLATVKSMVLEGFGVGALLDFMLEPGERDVLEVARLEHDPDCGLFLLRSPTFSSARSIEIFDTLRDALCEVITSRAGG